MKILQPGEKAAPPVLDAQIVEDHGALFFRVLLDEEPVFVTGVGTLCRILLDLQKERKEILTPEHIEKRVRLKAAIKGLP